MAKAKKAEKPREMIERIRIGVLQGEPNLYFLRYHTRPYRRIRTRPTTPSFKLDMWPKQREAMQHCRQRLTVILKARTTIGVDWLALIYAAWVMLTPGKLVIALSRTEEEAKELVRRLGVIFSAMPECQSQTNRNGFNCFMG